jgi:hypothetical protein
MSSGDGPRSILETLATLEALIGEMPPRKATGFNREGIRDIEFG